MLKQNLLRAVARAYGLQCSYKDIEGKIVWSPEKTLIKLIEVFTHSKISSNQDLENILKLKISSAYAEMIKPCHVLWNGKEMRFKISSAEKIQSDVDAEVVLENKTTQQIHLKIQSERKTELGFKYLMTSDSTLPEGYHVLNLTIANKTVSTFLICPPEKIQTSEKKTWGPFVPLYALKSNDDWGIGSFNEASMLATDLKKFNASWMGLLPMLAGNFDNADCDPSPYSSLTRLFWNEIYLDVDALVAKYNDASAKSLMASSDFKNKISELRKTTHVKYFDVYQMKKQVLIILADKFFEEGLNRSHDYLLFEKENPDINSYASFRSQSLREQNFHKFVQFEMNNTLKAFAEKNGVGLYMDYPVGVNDAGFDYKEYRSVFFGEVSVGAPPEPVFALGQDWGFPAFHPAGMQKDRYSYFRKSLQHHLKFCKILRLDHIMGLHRIYSVPKKFKGDEGVYLRFPPEELFAVVLLEAHRAKADLIGENLGTVPAAVEKIINERNLNGMWVFQCETFKSPKEAFGSIKANSLACINTHDMPMLASFRKGSDLALVESLGILSNRYKTQFEKERHEQMKVYDEFLSKENFTVNLVNEIAASKAKYFVVNLEDLWNEEQPQNIPGTWKEYPNWRKKFTKDLSSLMEDAKVVKAFSAISEHRK